MRAAGEKQSIVEQQGIAEQSSLSNTRLRIQSKTHTRLRVLQRQCCSANYPRKGATELGLGIRRGSGNRRFGTKAIHAGSEPDAQTGAVVVPISVATTFAQAQPGVPSGSEQAASWGNGYEYSRTGNPTRGAYELQVAACENGDFCVAFSSGVAAISAITHLCKSGDHVICIDDVYGGTQRYFRRIAGPNYGIEFSFMPFHDLAQLEAAITQKTRMIWIESPTNPLLKIVDIAKVSDVARRRGVLTCVDNTFMSPFFQTPLDLGADIVMHSVTKYMGGHSDVVGGVAVTNDADINEQLRFIQNGMGAVPSPFDCFLVMRGMKTLHVRMQRAMENARAVAGFLEGHEMVERVLYPGLESHPQYELAQEQMHGPGAMITFYIKGGLPEATTFMSSMRLFALAESLGAVESLCESPAIMTHHSVPPEVRAELGISDTLIRLSVGIEDEDDLLDDIAFGLQAASETAAK